MKKYEKGAVLGEGTFGKVIRATHKEVCPFLSMITAESSTPDKRGGSDQDVPSGREQRSDVTAARKPQAMVFSNRVST